MGGRNQVRVHAASLGRRPCPCNPFGRIRRFDNPACTPRILPVSEASSPLRLKDCGFCRILAGKAEASFLFRDERVAAFMDITPVNPGHLLVIPNRHAVYLSELDPADGARIFEVAQSLAVALRRSGLKCEAVNLFLADGEQAGQEVPHAHLHVIPRFRGDGFGLKLPPGYGRKAERSELDKIATAIKAGLSQPKQG
jgi:histidine triad (HIT) family protein